QPPLAGSVSSAADPVDAPLVSALGAPAAGELGTAGASASPPCRDSSETPWTPEENPPPPEAASPAARAAVIDSEVCCRTEPVPAPPPSALVGAAPGAKSAAGRSGVRTSTYRACAEVGSASTRASERHFACRPLASPQQTSR